MGDPTEPEDPDVPAGLPDDPPATPADPASDPPATPADPPDIIPAPVEPFPDVQETVWASDRPTSEEILEAIATMSVTDFLDLQRRFKIAFALNGISDEYRRLSARERMTMIEKIIEEQDAEASS